MITAAIPFVRTGKNQSPNLKSVGDPTESYMRAMVVTFASISRWNPGIELVLVTNDNPAPHQMEWLDRLGVKILITPFDHRPPPGYMNQFEGCLFLLDALQTLRNRDVLYLDPDVLCVSPLDSLFNYIAHSAAGLIIDLPLDEDINGLSRREAGLVHLELGMPLIIPDHIGGEVYFVPSGLSNGLIHYSEIAWRHALRTHELGQRGLRTEEHILTYALRNVPTKDLGSYVRRIWTAHRYRTVRGDEGSLALWHLPAEKDRGFAELFGLTQDQSSWFWRTDPHDFIDRSARIMGLRKRPARRLLLDLAGNIASRINVLK